MSLAKGQVLEPVRSPVQSPGKYGWNRSTQSKLERSPSIDKVGPPFRGVNNARKVMEKVTCPGSFTVTVPDLVNKEPTKETKGLHNMADGFLCWFFVEKVRNCHGKGPRAGDLFP